VGPDANADCMRDVLDAGRALLEARATEECLGAGKYCRQVSVNSEYNKITEVLHEYSRTHFREPSCIISSKIPRDGGRLRSLEIPRVACVSI